MDNTLAYQNAILKLLNGETIENETHEQTGGNNATEALEKVFLEGGGKKKKRETYILQHFDSKNEIGEIIEDASDLAQRDDDADNIIKHDSITDDDVDYAEKVNGSSYTSENEEEEYKEQSETDESVREIMDEIKKHETENGKLMGGGIIKKREMIIDSLDKYPYVLRDFK